jgi:hypothetical protein
MRLSTNSDASDFFRENERAQPFGCALRLFGAVD